MSVTANRLKVVALAAALAAGGVAGTELFRGAQFARAQDQVEDARANLASAHSLSTAFKSVARAVEPSVVSIEVSKRIAAGDNRGMPERLRRFFDRPQPFGDEGEGMPGLPPGMPGMPEGPQGEEGEAPFAEGRGSGVIVEVINGKAMIVTNNHVASGADKIVITLSDGREVKSARVIGVDPKTDLAVIEAEVDRVIPAPWGDSDKLERGDIVLAFGSPLGYVGSMTQGIVSALNRQSSEGGGMGILGRDGYERFIQTDAAINPGNSGGPLVNLNGEVVGINTAIASRTGGFQGIGFAIPSSMAKYVYEQLKSDGKVTRGWLGVQIMDVSNLSDAEASALGVEDDQGIKVDGTIRGTPAWGILQPGDVIVGLNGTPIAKTQDLRAQIAMTRPGDEVKIKLIRDRKEENVSVVVGKQPENAEEMASAAGRGGRPAEATTAEVMGMALADRSPELVEKFSLEGIDGGVVVKEVAPRGMAAKAGLRPGDVINRVNDQEVNSADQAEKAISESLKQGVRMFVANADGSRFLFVQPDGD